MSSEPMTITLTNEIQRMLPPRVRRKAGFKAGDQLEVKAIGGIVTLISKPATADEDDEYTPEQRRAIDAQLDEAEKGPFHGPFNSADEMITHMKSELRKRAATKRKRT
ncbi:MAG: hypothetical protein HY235_18720 [Acidobacteria bacterium]|nr:hypothetical protein [Acidobacteriota bacterium]